METIKVDQGVVKGKAGKVSTGATLFQSGSLSPTDSESTITANQARQQAFQKSQSSGTKLAGAISQEAVNIRSLGVRFQEFDQMAANIFKN